MSRAEQQPVAAVGAGLGTLLDEAAERGHAGAGTDHDDVARCIGRNAEALVGFDVDRGVVAFVQRGKEAAGRADMRVAEGLVIQHVDGKVHFFADALAAGGDGIQAWGQWTQRGDQFLRLPMRGPAAQHVGQLVRAEQRGKVGIACRGEQVVEFFRTRLRRMAGQERAAQLGQLPARGQPFAQWQAILPSPAPATSPSSRSACSTSSTNRSGLRWRTPNASPGS